MAALRDASDSAGEALQGFEGKSGIGAGVRRAQLLGNRGVLSRVLRELFAELGDLVSSDQSHAAGLAARLMYEDERHIWKTVEPNKDKRRKLEEGMEHKARRNVQSMMTRVLGLEIPLSRRIYHSKALAEGQVSRVVNNHLARGSSADELAKDVREFFNPATPGGVPSAARRLARTEINNAFHAQTIADAQERPWITQMEWHLSGSHPPTQPECACDRYARTKVFPVGDVPRKPHPNCLCYVTPVLPDLDTAFKNYMSGQYGNYLGTL